MRRGSLAILAVAAITGVPVIGCSGGTSVSFGCTHTVNLMLTSRYTFGDPESVWQLQATDSLSQCKTRSEWLAAAQQSNAHNKPDAASVLNELCSKFDGPACHK